MEAYGRILSDDKVAELPEPGDALGGVLVLGAYFMSESDIDVLFFIEEAEVSEELRRCVFVLDDAVCQDGCSVVEELDAQVEQSYSCQILLLNVETKFEYSEVLFSCNFLFNVSINCCLEPVFCFLLSSSIIFCFCEIN